MDLAKVKSGLSASSDASLHALLDLTFREMGVDAERCTNENWRDISRRLLSTLDSYLLAASVKAQEKLRHDVSPRLLPVLFVWDQRSTHVGGINFRPPDEFFFREDQAHDQITKGTGGGELYVSAELGGARRASNPGGYLSPVLYLELHVGYRACQPLKWLINNWRRPLEKLLIPLGADLGLNGHENSAVKAFRGKDTVRKAELYLSDPGDDPAVTWNLTFHLRTKEEEVVRALSVFLAIYDAIYSLQVKRCDPDRIHRHFLALEPSLLTLPFRDGFYDPGITRRSLIEDWNKRHPEDPIPLGDKCSGMNSP
jgi:hypothetical protein